MDSARHATTTNGRHKVPNGSVVMGVPSVACSSKEAPLMVVLDKATSIIETTVHPSAVAWINGRRAIVATMGSEGQLSTCELNRGVETEPDYLAEVVQVIGDRERVLILGPNSVRLGLEREYVTAFRRWDRLVDVEPASLLDVEALVDRLRVLAG